MILAETVFQSIDASVSLITVLLLIGLIGFFVLTSRVYRLLKTTNEILKQMQTDALRLDALVTQARKQSEDLAAMRRYYEPAQMEPPEIISH